MSFSPTLEENAEQGMFASEKNLRILRLVYVPLGLLIVVLGSSAAWTMGAFADSGFFFVPFGLTMTGLGLFTHQFVKYVWRSILLHPESRNHIGPRTVRASDEGLVVEYVTGMSQRIPWSSFIKARRSRLAMYLMVTRQFFIVVPDRAFPEDEIAREFVTLCGRKIADNNFEKLDKRDRAILARDLVSGER